MKVFTLVVSICVTSIVAFSQTNVTKNNDTTTQPTKVELKASKSVEKNKETLKSNAKGKKPQTKNYVVTTTVEAEPIQPTQVNQDPNAILGPK